MRTATIDTRIVNGLTLVTLSGELDIASAPVLRRSLCASEGATLPDLAVDLRDVVFMDCSVVGILITVRKRVAAAGGCLRLIGTNRGPLSLIKLCRLDGVLCVHDSVDAATTPACDRRHASAC